MSFLRHEPCPKCREQGKDVTGNNLARYSNGSGFCFSCRHIEMSTKWAPPVKEESDITKELPNDLTTSLAPENKEWLTRYLNESEISENFKYSPKWKRHVYTNGTYFEARSVNKNVPIKVISGGEKPFVIFPKSENSPLVIVEDLVSAIKVSRVATALPLFGSHLSGEWMVRIVKMGFANIVLWLDADKLLEARGFARRLNNLTTGLATVRYTEKDPKEYSEEEILQVIKEK